MNSSSHPLRPLIAILLLAFIPCTAPAEPPVPGGWSESEVKDASVVAAANFAIAEQGKKPGFKGLALVSIVSAEQQVVAGTNYSLELKVTLAGKAHTASATVWHQPWNKTTPYQLTAWELK